jgi:hypothetical protein
VQGAQAWRDKKKWALAHGWTGNQSAFATERVDKNVDQAWARDWLEIQAMLI